MERVAYFKDLMNTVTITPSENRSYNWGKKIQLLRSEIPSGICAKLRTVAASNNRVHMP